MSFVSEIFRLWRQASEKWRTHKRDVKKATAATRQSVMAIGNTKTVPPIIPDIEKTLSIIEDEINPINYSMDLDKVSVL